MKCENCFCIYQENEECILNDINIDITGQCDSCICVNIPSTDLHKYKKQLRDNFSNS